ncbi:MAG: hypothetical protein E7629_07160, partial [Ruminococcaceae bacterium]|nr:hypothetical protein [Oscillospiraceae bacterium]
MSMKAAKAKNAVLHGIGISNGRVGGVLRFFHRQKQAPNTTALPPASPTAERKRLQKALQD